MKMIKFTLILACLFSVSSQVNAQFSLSMDTTSVLCIEDTSKHIDIEVNNDGADATIRWTYQDFVAPSGWSMISICDNLTCYYTPALGFQGVSDVVGSGNTMILQVTIGIPASAAPGDGYGVFQLVGGGSTLTAVAHGSVCPQSIEILDEDDIKIAQSQDGIAILKNTINSASQYQIYDIQGRMITSGILNEVVTPVTLSESSIYILQILNDENQALTTKKFSVF